MRELYTIDFNSITSNDELIKRLKDDKYWVYSYVMKPYDLDNPKMLSRVSIQNNALYVIKHANDGDFTGNNLNPRTELRLGSIKLDKYKNYYIKLVNKITSSNFSAEFLQIMGRERRGPGPLLQLEVRNKKFSVRFARLKESVNYLFDVKPYLNKTLTWEIAFMLTEKDDGYFNVYLDGKCVYTTVRQTFWNNDSQATIQYGVYASNKSKVDMKIYIDSLVIKESSNPINSVYIPIDIPTDIPTDMPTDMPENRVCKLHTHDARPIQLHNNDIIYDDEFNIEWVDNSISYVKFYVNNLYICTEHNRPYVLFGDSPTKINMGTIKEGVNYIIFETNLYKEYITLYYKNKENGFSLMINNKHITTIYKGDVITLQ